MYDQSSTYCDVDEARFDLFARKQSAYDAIPPIQAALTSMRWCAWNEQYWQLWIMNIFIKIIDVVISQ